MRLERAPALEAIVVGNGELRFIQLCIRFRGAQRGEPLLGGFPEPIEIGIRGQSLRHGTPSFSAPGDRNSRARKKDDVSSNAVGGLDPLRGPSVACSTIPSLTGTRDGGQPGSDVMGAVARGLSGG